MRADSQNRRRASPKWVRSGFGRSTEPGSRQVTYGGTTASAWPRCRTAKLHWLKCTPPTVSQSSFVCLQFPRPHSRGDSCGQGWYHGQQSPAVGSAQDDCDLNPASSALKKSHGVAGNGAHWPPAGFSVRPVQVFIIGSSGALMVLKLHRHKPAA